MGCRSCALLGDSMARKRLKLATPKDVRQSLSRVANMVLNGELEAKDANAIIYTCNVILGAIRTDEQERRLRDLEQLFEERGIR